MLEKLLEKIKASLRIWMHINFLKVHGGVDPCAAFRARVARLEGVTRMLIGCIEDTKKYPDMRDDFVEELEAARRALEEK